MSRTVSAAIGAIAAASLTVACESSRMPSSPSTAASERQESVSSAGTGAQRSNKAEIYMADLKPLNSQVGYRAVSGKARFQIVNGSSLPPTTPRGCSPG